MRSSYHIDPTVGNLGADAARRRSLAAHVAGGGCLGCALCWPVLLGQVVDEVLAALGLGPVPGEGRAD
jgi:hypothetical protein